MSEPKEITVKKITKDDLLGTYPRVIAKVVNDKNKEISLTIFVKKAKEQNDGKTTPEIIPQEGHKYMGYFKKPKEGFHIWSFNIAYELSSQEPDEPVESVSTKDEPTDSYETEIHTGDEDPEKSDETPDPDNITEMHEKFQDSIDITHPLEVDIRLRVAEIEVARQNRLTTKISMVETIKNCKTWEAYITGE